MSGGSGEASTEVFVHRRRGPAVVKVAVTGATGHVALCLIPRLLTLGHEVRAVCYGDARCLEGLPVERVQADVRDGRSMDAALRGQELVVHLAAHISLRPEDEALMRRVNVDGVRHTAAAARRNGLRRMVHVSSVHAFDTWRLERPLTERDPKALRPTLPSYDRSKALGEAALQEHIAGGLDATILNPVGILGPHDHRPSVQGQVLREIYRGRVPVVADGHFCWIDVRDVVEAIVAAMERGARGENYLLSGEEVSGIGLHELVWAAGAPRRRTWVAPVRLLRWLAPFAPLLRRLSPAASSLSADALHALDARLAVDSSKARAALGLRPRPIAESIRDAVAWWQKRGLLS